MLSALLLLSAPAAAQEKASFRERYDQAAALYKANQYAEAVTAFQALYDEKQVPILLFNIAQAHRRAGLLEDAVPFYERFLKENPKPELQKEAEGYLKEIRDMLDFTLHTWDVVGALGLKDPILVGHSMGGMIAAEMAAITLDLIENPETTPTHHECATTLVIRNSCGCTPAPTD